MIGCIIQTRMTSTRLPGKVMMPIYKGKNMLEVVLRRLKKSKLLDEIIVATTVNKTDDVIINFCENELKDMDIKTFRGSEDNVLERYYQAAKYYDLDIVIRVTSDCPLIDWQVLDDIITYYMQNYPKYDYVSNTIIRTYPRGLGVEVLSFKTLERVFRTSTLPSELEHVTTKILVTSPEEFSRYAYVQSDSKDDSNYRLTVDTPEDLLLIKAIYEGVDDLYMNLETILEYLRVQPQLLEINKHIKQKAV